MNKTNWKIIPSALLFLLIIFMITNQNNAVFGQDDQSNNNDTFRTIPTNISGITCDKVEHLVYHNHTKLVIKIQNETQNIPAGIGIIPNDCIFWLHTHDDSGIIHVESPIKTAFSLDQFLKVWDIFDNSSFIENFSKNNMTANVSMITENGSQSKLDNYKNIILENNAIITVDLVNKSKD
ncbi:hypothetical protein NMY3_03395 [Candidatus Nitrosocosmicus oleophilus]|uniref:Uncharacterized protein n=1 Tax=Candidatus Nitrosocosmicus oleophilus TaxID=1353260 RepID=A0A654M1F7_9ARCH|nr:hypothetical protein [Candidatus Nitrosocosmicus oleophilus]ALI37578.1 hypothetical protein NMY3_03395 [Candidatus Nitrosocosmicus oleophilus]